MIRFLSIVVAPVLTAALLSFSIPARTAADAGGGGVADAGGTGHWAYVKPKRAALPDVQQTDWPVGPIDYFVLKRLEQQGFSPSPPADKVTLIRRVTFDLTGLPPTPDEVAAFLADTAPDAYEALVDRLLASAAYGERMTAWWLDLARYADTHGYEGDGSRTIWLYRDWVINAFHTGLPFDQFTIQQLAGDLLPNATDLERVATGFHRNSPFCYEAGTDFEQFRVESVVDRVNTTMTVWMGTTMGCAQCHDHKYDPISQREYYGLYAFFNNSAETDGAGPTVETYSPLATDQSDRLAELRAALAVNTPELEEAQQHWEASYRPRGTYQIVVPDVARSLEGAELTVQDDHSLLAGGENPDHDVYELTFQSPGISLAALGMEVLKDESLPHGGPGRYPGNGNFGLSDLTLEYALPTRPDSWQRVRFGRALATYEEAGDAVVGAVDDDRASNWCTNQNAAHAVFVADKVTPLPSGCQIRIRMHHNSQYPQHGVGRFRFWTASAESLDDFVGDDLTPLPILAALSTPPADRTAAQQQTLSEQFRSTTPLLAATREAIASIEAQTSTATTLVMFEREEPRETRLLIRGSFLDPGEAVEAAVPSAWHDWPDAAPVNRLGLARWLTHPENPLVGRVTMNRIWALMFGKGLVETSEDFGIQGSRPSHPLLLDYLAGEFVDGGWDLQAMQKQIVMSATYRQSSRMSADHLERDPDNRLFARGPAFRMDAEMIRDSALAASGLLTRRLGGPGVYPYQPPGVYEQIHSFTTPWETNRDGNQYRRALYTWWKRTAPYPSMITFDAPRRDICVERRPRTNTPLQALVTLNDPVFVQCAAALGRRMATEVDGDPQERVRHGFQLCLARLPTDAEVDQLVELYHENLEIYANDEAGAVEIASADLEAALPANLPPAEVAAWSVVGNVLLNLDETLTKY